MSRKNAEALAWALHRRVKIPPRIIRIGRSWAAYLDNDILPAQVDKVFRMCKLLCRYTEPGKRFQVMCRYGDSMGLPVFDLDPNTKYQVLEVEFSPYP